jgi:hypothetical protein
MAQYPSPLRLAIKDRKSRYLSQWETASMLVLPTQACNFAALLYCPHMNALSPIVSEFETLEQAEAYAAWLRAKVAASLADGRPTIAHDKAMTQVRKIIEDKRAAEARLAR